MISEDIFSAAKSGDVCAFEQIYNQTHNKAYSVAMSVVKDEYDAQDIVQDAFVTLYQKIDTVNEPNKLEAWFYRIVKNQAIDFLRKKRPEVFAAFEGDEEHDDFSFVDTIKSEYREYSPEESLEDGEIKHTLDRMIDALPEKQRICVRLRYEREMKISDIAKETGYPEATVKSCLKYGTDKLYLAFREDDKMSAKFQAITPFAFLSLLRGSLGNPIAGIMQSLPHAPQMQSPNANAEGGSAAQNAENPQTAEPPQSAEPAQSAQSTPSASSSAAPTGMGTNPIPNAVPNAALNAAKTAAKTGAGVIAKRIIIGGVAAAVLATGAATVPVSNGNTAIDCITELVTGTVSDARRDVAVHAMIDFAMTKSGDGYLYSELGACETEEERMAAVGYWFVANGENSEVSDKFDMKYLFGVPSDEDYSDVWYALFGENFTGSYQSLKIAIGQIAVNLIDITQKNETLTIGTVTEKDGELAVPFSDESGTYLAHFTVDKESEFGFVYKNIEKIS